VVRDIDDDKNARKNAILLSNDNSGFKKLIDFRKPAMALKQNMCLQRSFRSGTSFV
jgi:hypothetical protein